MKTSANVKFMGNTIVIQSRFPFNMEDGEYDVEIKPVEKDKTKRQVNYFWGLMREVCKKLDGNTKEIERYYGQMLKMANVKIDNIWIKNEALDEFKRLVGHFIVKENKNGFSLIEVYKGVSQMDVKEMQELIDVELRWAQELGIDTTEWEGIFYGSSQ